MKKRALFGTASMSSLKDPLMGVEIALANLAKHLALRGWKVDVRNLYWLSFSPQEYDLIHLWNTVSYKGPYSLAIDLAHSVNRPVFFTPTYWGFGKASVLAAKVGLGWGKDKLKEIMKTEKEMETALALALSKADVVTPASQGEKDRVTTLLTSHGQRQPRIEIVWNTFDDDLFSQAKPRSWKSREPWVVSIGRVEAAKNTLSLVRGFKRFREKVPEAKLIVIGVISPSYLERNRYEMLGEGIEYWGPIHHTKIPGILAKAKVHALLSVHEIPGLVSIEAAAMGCNIVVSTPEYGTMREYFGPLAFESNPFDPDAIAEALLNAWHSPGTASQLKEHVWNRFRASKIAAELEQLYLEKLG